MPNISTNVISFLHHARIVAKKIVNRATGLNVDVAFVRGHSFAHGVCCLLYDIIPRLVQFDCALYRFIRHVFRLMDFKLSLHTGIPIK